MFVYLCVLVHLVFNQKEKTSLLNTCRGILGKYYTGWEARVCHERQTDAKDQSSNLIILVVLEKNMHFYQKKTMNPLLHQPQLLQLLR